MEGGPSREAEASDGGDNGRLVLELERAVGFAGSIRDCVRWSSLTHQIAFPAGACAVVWDPSDPHGQVFLRGHSDVVTALDLSSSVSVPTSRWACEATCRGAQGRFLATGQGGADADVVVWDMESKAVLFRFEEHDHGISSVAFSTDEVRLASSQGP
jgi:WD40 repeat protein